MAENRKRFGYWLTGMAALLASATLAINPASAAQPTFNIGEQPFQEAEVDSWILADFLSTHTHLNVKVHLSGGYDGLMNTLIQKNDIQAYVDYDGSQFGGVIGAKYTAPFRKNEWAVWQYVRNYELKHWHIWESPSLGFEDTYCGGVTEATAKKYHLKTDAQLAKYAPGWTIATDPTFQTLAGVGYKAWAAAYHLKFQQVRAMDYDLMYTALSTGTVQAAVLYSTDGRLEKMHLVCLSDPLHVFPPYHGVIMIRQDALNQYHLATVLKPLWNLISTAEQTHLNYLTTVGGESPQLVAKNFLLAKHLITPAEARHLPS
jgi:osmoprotectant transport system substrate-binding protein